MTPEATVAANLLWCVPDEVGGSEQYLVRQLLGLAEIDAPLDVSVFAPPSFARRHPDLGRHARLVDGPSDGRRRWRRVIDEATWLRRHTSTADLVHHGGGTAPLAARRPYVLTIHDLQYRTFPEHFSRQKRAYLSAMVPRSVRAARLVTVPSDYVRSTVIDEFGIAPERVVVVPHGYEPALLADVTPADELRRRYSLGTGPVIVYPAVTHPHKNHLFLVDLLTRSWPDPDLRLVLLGAGGSAEGALVEAIDHAGAEVARRIVRTGRVPDADRNGLLAMAHALVFPSRYEGFGAPVIEAMALGAPVVCSDATCLPGIVGDAGIVRPLELAAWSGALDEADRRRAELVEAGRRRVEAFTARRSGEALLGAYREALR